MTDGVRQVRRERKTAMVETIPEMSESELDTKMEQARGWLEEIERERRRDDLVARIPDLEARIAVLESSIRALESTGRQSRAALRDTDD